MGGLSVLLRPLNLATTVILARLLDPTDFGLIALAMVLLSTTNLFTGLGLGAAIVHSADERKKIAFPAFLLTLVMGLLFYSILIFNVDFLAGLLGSGEVAPILSWLSLLILFNAVNLVPGALLRKELMFRQVSAVSALQEVTYLLLSIGFAYAGFGVWSLVYAQLASRVVKTISLWLLTPGWDWVRPVSIDWAVSQSLIRYGLKAFSSGLTSYIHSNWDDWLVGRALGTASLGLYSKAYQFSNKTLGRIAQNTVGTVFFSTYVKLRGNDDAIRRVYIKSVQMVLVFMVPISLGMALLAPQLVSLVLGSKWVPMTTAFQIFALIILSRPISENSAPFFQALGRPEFNTRAGLLLLAIMVPLALLLLPWGINGIALAVTLSHCLGAVYNVYQTETLISGIAVPTLRACIKIYAAGLLMAIGVYGVNKLILMPTGIENSVLGLMLSVIAGGLFYAVALFFLKPDLLQELLGMAMGRLGSLNHLIPNRLQRYLKPTKTPA